MMKRSSSRISSEILLFLVLSLAMSTMSGCVAAEVTDGVFAVRVENGVPEQLVNQRGYRSGLRSLTQSSGGRRTACFCVLSTTLTWRQISAAPVTGVPGWSPEGTHVAYIDRDRASLIVVDVTSGDEIFAQPLDRRRSQNSRFPLFALGGPVWAPDGSRIAYVCWDGIGDEICFIQPDGTGWRQVTRIERPRTYGQNETQQSGLAASNTGPPAWSPEVPISWPRFILSTPVRLQEYFSSTPRRDWATDLFISAKFRDQLVAGW